MLTRSQKSHVSRARHRSHAVGSQRGRVAVLCGVLFLSGTGALIFETLWLRLSGLAFGNSIWAAALILSSFMAGLALGNALAASSRIRRWRPLHFYAVLELLVALLGCTIVFGRFSDAQFWRSLARFSRQLAVSGIISPKTRD